MKILIDQENCIGCGLCADICGATRMNKDGKAEPIPEADLSTKEAQDAVRLAVEACPVQVITIIEE